LRKAAIPVGSLRERREKSDMEPSELERLELMLRNRRKSLSTVERRIAYDELSTLFPTAPDVARERLSIGSIGAEWTGTDAAVSGRAIVYLHGGGYVYGSLESHRHLAVAGDSAGGGLAVAMMVRLRELNLPQPICALLFSPWVDMQATGDSYRANAERDPVVSREIIAFCALQYLGAGGCDSPLASPVRANLREIAPLTIFAGAGETLLDDAIQLARVAGLANVPVRLEIWPDVVHIWPTYHQMFARGREALLRAGQVIRDAFEKSPLPTQR